jgi:hypothetical protein
MTSVPGPSNVERRYAVGDVIYVYDEALVPSRVGQRMALPNGQVAKVLTAKRSDGAVEARKLTVRVIR